jgi:hypothetical protein
MDDLERELRRSLRRVEPRAGFADRVMAKLDAPVRETPRRAWMAPGWAVAAGLAVVLAGGSLYHQQQERARAEAARDQLLLALEITAKQLDHLRRQVNSQESR